MNSNEYQQQFANRINNIFISHPSIENIYNRLDSIRVNKKIKGNKCKPKHLFITGPSGVGKSLMAEHYILENEGYVYIDEEGTEFDVKPVIYIEAPEPFTIGELYQSIISALGAPRLVGRPTIGEIKTQAFTLLEKQKVEMLIIDEIDYAMDGRHVKPIEAMKTLKHISNRANVSVVCIGTPETESLRITAFQYFRRFPLVKLKKFSECNEEFCCFLNNIEMQIQPPKPLNLGKREAIYPEFFFRISKGLVSIVTSVIQEAYKLVGVSAEHPYNVEKAIITPSILAHAYELIFGDVDEEEFTKILNINIKGN